MLELISELFRAQNFLQLCVGAIVFWTMVSLLSSVFQRDRLAERMQAITDERAIRRRAQMAAESSSGIRQKNSEGVVKDVVERLNLSENLDGRVAKDLLEAAGLRSQKALFMFLFSRVLLPLCTFGVCMFYTTIINDFGQTFFWRVLYSAGLALFTFFLPNIIVGKMAKRRALAIKKAFPDALDLLLICMEAGMSMEAALRRIMRDIGGRSIELAEELAITTAELSYLQERRQAYINFGKRTRLEDVKTFATSVIQAEKYGTPLVQALDTLARENRQQQMTNAEKKAASLGPKLTIPMILFFLPVLFIVILAPAVITSYQQLGQ